MLLSDRLEHLADELMTTFPRINSGGCALVAGRVAEHLSRFPELRARGVVADTYGYDNPSKYWGRHGVRLRNSFNSYSLSLNTLARRFGPDANAFMHKSGVDFSHVLVRFRLAGKAYVFDATGVHTFDPRGRDPAFDARYVRGSIPPLDITPIYHSTDWNPTFDHTRADEVIEIIDSWLDGLTEAELA